MTLRLFLQHCANVEKSIITSPIEREKLMRTINASVKRGFKELTFNGLAMSVEQAIAILNKARAANAANDSLCSLDLSPLPRDPRCQ